MLASYRPGPRKNAPGRNGLGLLRPPDYWMSGPLSRGASRHGQQGRRRFQQSPEIHSTSPATSPYNSWTMQLNPVLIGSSEDAFHHGRPVRIVAAARRRHLAVFGGTGSGKSTLLRNMLAGDIAAGHGVTVVDPHGQLVDEILENHIPRHRTNDVIYFNPKDQVRAFALNLLDCPRKEQR